MRELNISELNEMLDSDDESVLVEMTEIGTFDRTMLERFKAYKKRMPKKTSSKTCTCEGKTKREDEAKEEMKLSTDKLNSIRKQVDAFEKARKVDNKDRNNNVGSKPQQRKPLHVPLTTTLNTVNLKPWWMMSNGPLADLLNHKPLFSSSDRERHPDPQQDQQADIATQLKNLYQETVRHNRVMEEKIDHIRNLLSIVLQGLHNL